MSRNKKNKKRRLSARCVIFFFFFFAECIRDSKAAKRLQTGSRACPSRRSQNTRAEKASFCVCFWRGGAEIQLRHAELKRLEPGTQIRKRLRKESLTGIDVSLLPMDNVKFSRT